MRDFNFIDFFIQRKRIQQVAKYIPQTDNLLDIGCGIYPYLLYTIKHKIKKGIGIDKEIPKDTENIEFMKATITDKILIDSESINVITMLAVLEHFMYPRKILDECKRILKKNGIMIITVPSYYSRPLLTFLAWTGLGSREEIYDHKNWFKREDLEKAILEKGLEIIKSSYYNFGLNILLVCRKN